jgi:hypothetical protein
MTRDEAAALVTESMNNAAHWETDPLLDDSDKMLNMGDKSRLHSLTLEGGFSLSVIS